jgi:hypothetical protein
MKETGSLINVGKIRDRVRRGINKGHDPSKLFF